MTIHYLYATLVAYAFDLCIGRAHAWYTSSDIPLFLASCRLRKRLNSPPLLMLVHCVKVAPSSSCMLVGLLVGLNLILEGT